MLGAILVKYRAEIDGLRALAVISVVIFHFYPAHLGFGYLGVDIFFVISGYLITAHLLHNQSMPYAGYLQHFYVRRIKRLFPALFVFLLATSVLVSAVYLVADLKKFLQSLIATQTFWANWYFWRDGGYFGGNDQIKPLLHMWSLSVEEQFYIIFPTFLFLLALLGRRITFAAGGGIILATAGSFLLWFHLNRIGGENPAFFLLPTRAWEFGLGAIAAYVHGANRFQKVTQSGLLAYLAVALFAIGFFYPVSLVANTIIVTCGAAIFILCTADKRNLAFWLFSLPVPREIGKISYSLYLYHWPIAAVLLYILVEPPGFLLAFAGILLSVLLGWLSYRFVETPFRYKFPFWKTLSLVIAMALLSIAITLSVIKLTPPSNASKLAENGGTHFRCPASAYIPYGASRACRIGQDGAVRREIVLLGNSHAQMFAPLVSDVLAGQGMSGLLVPLNSCLPTTTINIDTVCLAHAEKNLEALMADPDLKMFVIASTWYGNDYVDVYGQKSDKENLPAAFLDLRDRLKREGIEMVLFSPLPVPYQYLASELPRLIKFGRLEETELEGRLRKDWLSFHTEYEALNETFRQSLGNAYLEVYRDLCDAEYCYFGQGSEMFYADSNHLSQHALERLELTRAQLQAFIGAHAPFVTVEGR